MELFVLAPKMTLPAHDWQKIKSKMNVHFIDKEQQRTYTYNAHKGNKILLLEPNFVDWWFSNENLEKIENLVGVCVTTTSTSYVDEKYLKEHHIPLLPIPKYSTNSVAEYLVFLMMCVARKLPLQLKNQKQIYTEEYIQFELTGKIAGIVGLGNIGQKVCEITKGLGMTPIYYNRTPKDSPYQSVSLEQLFQTADVVFITLANNPETRLIVTDELIRSMKKTAILIDGTDADLHNEQLVLDRVKNKQLYGAGYEMPNHSYEQYEGNIMVTSQYAWYTKEAYTRRKEKLMENLLSFAK